MAFLSGAWMRVEPSSKADRHCALCEVHDNSKCLVGMVSDECPCKRVSTVRKLKRGEVLVSQGDRLPLIGVVMDGVLRLAHSTLDGRQHIVGLSMRPNMIGHPHSDTSRYSIAAATEVTLSVFDREAFRSIVEEFPQLERVFLEIALDELDAARHWTALIGPQRVKGRIAAFLLMCRSGEQAARIVVPINRQDMAELLGTTPETISRFVRELMRQRVLRKSNSREFKLLDSEALKVWAGQIPLTPDQQPAVVIAAGQIAPRLTQPRQSRPRRHRPDNALH